MRVIRPSELVAARRRRRLLVAAGMVVAGLLAGVVAGIAGRAVLGSTAAGLLAAAAAIAIGVGAAWLVRALDLRRGRSATERLVRLLEPIFDDTYTLIVTPRLPVRGIGRLDGLLVGPPGVRAITVRDWHGRYRVRGRTWEFDAGQRRGWIRCRTNPSHEAVALAAGVARWAADAGLGDVPLRAAIAFPNERSRVVLEEPGDEVVTSDNGPWWANSIGRVRRLDPDAAVRFVNVVLDAAEAQAGPRERSLAGERS